MNITKIEGLDKAWIYIKQIDLQCNQIVTIEGLNRCKNLVYLNLGYNKITKIDDGAFDGLSNLKELHLYRNQIKKIENLELLVNLETLGLHDNQIKKIENLEPLVNLEVLDLG